MLVQQMVILREYDLGWWGAIVLMNVMVSRKGWMEGFWGEYNWGLILP